MSNPSVEDRVIMIVSEHLGRPLSEVRPDTRLAEDLNTDSLDLMEIMMYVEEEFEIAIPDEEAGQLKTIADAIALVKKLAPETA